MVKNIKLNRDINANYCGPKNIFYHNTADNDDNKNWLKFVESFENNGISSGGIIELISFGNTKQCNNL